MQTNGHASAARSAHGRAVTAVTRARLGRCTSSFRPRQSVFGISTQILGLHNRPRNCVASISHGDAGAQSPSAGPGTLSDDPVQPAASGPPVKVLFRETSVKADRDPASLTAKELAILVNGLPRHYRHKHVPPELVEEAFDGGMLTLHELARTLKVDLNVAVKHIGEKGQLRKALRLTDYLVRTQKANEHTLAAFFQACRNVDRPTAAARVWEMWVPSGLIGSISASSAINCVVSYDAEMGLAMLERMEHLGIKLHRNSYHQVIKALSESRNFQAGVRLFETMKEDRNLQPSAVTMQHLLGLISSCEAWEYTEDVYRYMGRAGIVPDAQLAATFMKVYCDAMEVHVAEIIFRSKLKKWNIRPNRFHYNALLVAHAKQGDLGSVKLLLREMDQDGVTPDEYTIVSALTAAARSPDTALADVELALTLARTHGLKRNMYVCGALVQAYRNCTAVPPRQRQELGEAVVADMEAAGTPVNSIIVNSLLALYWETFEYRKARQQYDKMLSMGVMPNARTCQIMVQMCEEAGWLEQADGFRQLRETMPELEGVSVETWNPSGEEHVQLGDDNEADKQLL